MSFRGFFGSFTFVSVRGGLVYAANPHTLPNRLWFQPCYQVGTTSQTATGLQAIQLYPCHPGLGARTLLHGFAVRPFTYMLLSRSSFLFR